MANIESRRPEDGTVSHREKVRLRGHATETATFARLTDARRWARATEAAIREGRYFRTAEAKRHTLADLVERYFLEVLPHKRKNASNTRLHLLWWKSKIGHLSLADVRHVRVGQFAFEQGRHHLQAGLALNLVQMGQTGMPTTPGQPVLSHLLQKAPAMRSEWLAPCSRSSSGPQGVQPLRLRVAPVQAPPAVLLKPDGADRAGIRGHA